MSARVPPLRVPGRTDTRDSLLDDLAPPHRAGRADGHPQVPSPAWLTLFVAGVAWLSMELSRQPGSVATIWYANAIAAAWLSALPLQRWLLPLLAIAAGVVAGNLLWGESLLGAIRFVPANLLESALAAVLLRRAGLAGSDLRTPRAMSALLLHGALLPQLAGATAGAATLATSGVASFGAIWLPWFEGSVVGASSMLPLAFLFVHRGPAAVLADCRDARLLVLLPLAVGTALLVLALLPLPFVYVALPLMLAAALLPLGAVALLTLAVSLTIAAALAYGVFVPPPVSALWHQVFVYLAIVAALVPSLFLAATMSALHAHRGWLRQRTRELHRANQGLQQFVHIASHDFREPLNTITQFGGLLQDDERDRLSPSGRSYLDTVTRAAARMRQLLDDVLAFTRLQQHQTVELDVVPLADTLDSVRLALAHRLQDPAARLDVGPLPCVRGHASLLALLFQNLIGNALKFMPEGRAPQITVESLTRGAMAEITVADNGIGIEADDLPRLFQPFQRLHVRRRFDGTGLGLALVRQVAELHGGSVRVSSVPGVGSRFTVVLPLA